MVEVLLVMQYLSESNLRWNIIFFCGAAARSEARLFFDNNIL